MTSENKPVKRLILSSVEQSQIDERITNQIKQLINFQGPPEQLAVYFLNNKNSMNKINWYKIDQNIQMKSYQSKSYSYRRFVDVIIPNILPPYPLEIQMEMNKVIKSEISKQWENLTQMNEKDLTAYRKQLEQQIKQQFDLKGTDLYSFKKQIDKNRYTISMLLRDIHQPHKQKEFQFIDLPIFDQQQMNFNKDLFEEFMPTELAQLEPDKPYINKQPNNGDVIIAPLNKQINKLNISERKLANINKQTQQNILKLEQEQLTDCNLLAEAFNKMLHTQKKIKGEYFEQEESNVMNILKQLMQ
ncbi:Hypothetical_protein [Hexamita inflata]|uniref:Hypothetical_protein n=1 Tax=Hexamita inflata TaxID=28002 RepID=A0AA86PRQ2_9EUKA|nr:Hypothetical protein HINF_LOCUS27487 [Hexamita inflata]